MPIGRAGLLAAGLLLASALAALAQTAEKPMNQAELVSLINAKTPVADIIAQVRARGYDFEINSELEAGLTKVEGGPELLAALRQPGTVEVTVNVAGAEVTVDAQARGSAPAQGALVVPGLAPGRHLVRVQAERYVGERAEVFLKPGETRRVEVKLGSAVEVRPGPLGTDINVRAGTPEDSLMAKLEATKDPAARVEQLRAMIATYGDSPMAVLGYRILQATHLEQNQFAEAVAAGEEVLKRDPQNFQARLRQTRAYLGQGNLDAAFAAAAAARQQLEEVRAQAGAESADDAARRQTEQALGDGESALQSLGYNCFAAAVQLPDPARKAAVLERYLELYPKSDYTQAARVNLAYTYQQLNNIAQAIAQANRALEANPNEASMLILVADVLSERGEDLARARQLAAQLLTLLEGEGARPPGMADEQWASLRPLWQGMAHSALGQMLMHEETATSTAGMTKTRQAIQEFHTASPLLKSQLQLYARNLLRRGFAHAKVGELVQARDALSEVISLDTPYREAARPYLDKVLEGLARKKQ